MIGQRSVQDLSKPSERSERGLGIRNEKNEWGGNVHVSRGGEFLWAVRVCVCWDSISSQLLGPSSLIFSGYVRVICGSAQFEFEPDPLKLTGVRSVGNRCLF